MFRKKERITTERFKEILEMNRSAHSDLIYAKYGENNLNFSRFSVVVPKKVAKLAVARHLVKRRINTYLKKYSEQFPNRDYLIFAKDSLVLKSSKEVDLAVQDLIKKLKG